MALRNSKSLYSHKLLEGITTTEHFLIASSGSQASLNFGSLFEHRMSYTLPAPRWRP
jgi:hypothetical protein